MRGFVLLTLLSLGACASPGTEQACAYYDSIGPCFNGRDITNRTNREDLANRTPVVAMSLADVTNRTNREDPANRTRVPGQWLGDITDRANREDLSYRARLRGQSLADITDRANRDDTRNRPLVCP
jgi:hypothetical protein